MSEDTGFEPEETPEERRARQNSYLKPVQPGEVRNPKGRGKGVPNTATIIRKWLAAKEEINNPITGKKGRLTQLDIMILAQVKKARDGDVTSFGALLDRMDGKPLQKGLLGSDPENPLPTPPPPVQVITLPNGQEIRFE